MSRWGNGFPGAPPTVEADANQLQQVLLNLLNNAREAFANWGEIRVETERADTRAGWARLAVIDDGPGIPPDVKSRIFVPFSTTKESGTGLGLPISYRIVRDHGGTSRCQRTRGGDDVRNLPAACRREGLGRRAPATGRAAARRGSSGGAGRR